MKGTVIDNVRLEQKNCLKEKENFKNRNIKKFIFKLSIFIILTIVIIALIIIGFTQLYTNKNRTSYQYALNLKYNNLINTDSPKIIIIGGSSAGFGINTDIIKKETKMNVVNLGLHAGFGTIFQTEIAKANIQKGDIVVLAYEYGLYMEDNMEAELITTGIDNNIGMYKYLNYEQFKQVIKYIPTYILKKIDKTSKEEYTSTYSISSFDADGNMILNRDKCALPFPVPIEIYNEVILDEVKINEEIKGYINEFSKYCQERDATVLISFPPILEERFVVTDKSIENFRTTLSESTKLEIISDIRDYIFKREYMYDTIYHCNNKGEKVRSERLANDINKYLEKGEK